MQVIKARERKISTLREQEVAAGEDTGARDRADWEQQRRLDKEDEAERRNRSEVQLLFVESSAANRLIGKLYNHGEGPY